MPEKLGIYATDTFTSNQIIMLPTLIALKPMRYSKTGTPHSMTTKRPKRKHQIFILLISALLEF